MNGSTVRTMQKQLWFGLLVSLTTTAPEVANACPFCVAKAETIAEKIAKADLVAICKPMQFEVVGARQWQIVKILKAPKEFSKQPILEFAKVVDVAPSESHVDRLIFARLVSGKLRPYRVGPAPTSAFAGYAAGAARFLERNDPQRWAYFVERMLESDKTIADDAFNELAKASVSDLRWSKASLPTERIKAAIGDGSTPADRIGLLGLLLGVAGSPADAGFLSRIIDAPTARQRVGLDGLIGGLFLLDPKAAMERAIAFLANGTSELADCRAAFRALQFALIEASAVDRSQIVDRMRPAVLKAEVGELVLDELRYRRVWPAWEQARSLLAEDERSRLAPRGAVVRFLLECPLPEARAALAEVRVKHPQAVRDAQQALRFEKEIREEWLRKAVGRSVENQR